MKQIITECVTCLKRFSRPDSLQRHVKKGCGGERIVVPEQGLMMFQDQVIVATTGEEGGKITGKNSGESQEIIIMDEMELSNASNITIDSESRDESDGMSCIGGDLDQGADFVCGEGGSACDGVTGGEFCHSHDNRQPWYLPSEDSVKKWEAQFLSINSTEDVTYRPFKNYLDERVFDYIYSQENPMTKKEKEGVLSLIEDVLKFTYNRLSTRDKLFPSSLYAMEKYKESFKLGNVVHVAHSVRQRGVDKGKLFPSQAVRLPSDIISNLLLCPKRSMGITRVFPKAPSHITNWDESPSILFSASVHDHCLISTKFVEVKHMHEGDRNLYTGDDVVYSCNNEIGRGTVVSIYLSECSKEKVMLGLEQRLQIALSDVMEIHGNTEGIGRRLLRRSGLDETVEILTIPLMIFSDDMNSGRSKVFSKMDNTVLILPSVPNLKNGGKSRHHIESNKAETLSSQLQPVMEDIRRLQRGAVMFDSHRKKKVLVIADLIAFLADNPRANDICGQVQKQCRYSIIITTQ